MSDYRDNLFDDTYECVYEGLIYKKEHDEGFTIEYLKGLLQSLYTEHGNDWIGKGEIKEITEAATIAACETVLYNW